jgi:hypothetical protein
MDLVPILNAAIKATGGNPNKDHVDVSDLERAQKALRYVDAHISKILGYTEIASVTLTHTPGD